jgi:predicted NUDIX family NTP pyrophosphohydrolase
VPRTSAGIALYRRAGDGIELFLAHPGGPFWKNRDDGAWTFPKGEYTNEDPLIAARREFREEIGLDLDGEFIDLGEVRQSGGKIVRVFAIEGYCDPAKVRSNTFRQVWPPKSGRYVEFPEVDQAGWFSPAEARKKLIVAQREFVERLCIRLAL